MMSKVAGLVVAVLACREEEAATPVKGGLWWAWLGGAGAGGAATYLAVVVVVAGSVEVVVAGMVEDPALRSHLLEVGAVRVVGTPLVASEVLLDGWRGVSQVVGVAEVR